MRYLVKARLKPGRGDALREAVENGSLGRGSVAGGEYIYNMQEARLAVDGIARWVEVCFCATPLAEERAYWEEYFELISVTDAHSRRTCRDENGTQPWACVDCNCTRRLEGRLRKLGRPFLSSLSQQVG